MKDLMINSNANKTFSDIPPFMIKTNDKMSAQAAEVLRTDRNQRFPGSKDPRTKKIVRSCFTL